MSTLRTHAIALVRGQHVRVNFRYHSNDPHTVYLTFVTTPPTGWVLDREMLSLGLDRRVGSGDIRLNPLPSGNVEMFLRSPNGQASVIFKKADLANIVEAMYRIVPDGSEWRHIDWAKEERYLFGTAA